MKVFISWSGDLSRRVALILRDWIENVLQGVEASVSSDDVEKGTMWFGDIAEQLRETGIGILCLTPDNVDAPWILFEAGALSKGLSKNRVCPFLINLDHADLRPPLSQFNGTLPNREDMLRLVQTINEQRGDGALTAERLRTAFDRWWDDFPREFDPIIEKHSPTEGTHRRTADEMVPEILEITRSTQKVLQEAGPALRALALAVADQGDRAGLRTLGARPLGSALGAWAPGPLLPTPTGSDGLSGVGRDLLLQRATEILEGRA